MRLSLLVFLVPLTACGTRAVQRTARVPHAAVPLHDGQPMEGRVALSVGLDNAIDVVQPAVGNAQASVETPAIQMRDELRVRVGLRGEVGMVYEGGLARYERADSTQAPVEQGSPTGIGVLARYSIDIGVPHWAVGVQAELIAWQIPYVEWETCVANCPGNVGYTTQGHYTDGARTFGFGVTPSYRSGPLTLFGGVFLRNHPTVTRKTLEQSGVEDFAPVEDGPVNAIVYAGASYAVKQGVSFLGTITQDLVRDPVQYYPGIGVAFQLELGDPPRTPAPH